MCWVVSSIEHAKKMVLVDSRILYQIKENDVYEHEKLLEKLHFRPVQKMDVCHQFRYRTYTRSRFCERRPEDENDSTALTRYLSATKNNEMS